MKAQYSYLCLACYEVMDRCQTGHCTSCNSDEVYPLTSLLFRDKSGAKLNLEFHDRQVKQDDNECDVCKGSGWIISTMYGSSYVPDGTLAVMKCDTCEMYKSDEEAAAESGLVCRLSYPCIIKKRNIPKELLV